MQAKGVNEAELARQTNIAQPTLHKILAGTTCDPRVLTLKALADYFEVNIDDLFTGNTNDKATQQAHSTPIISWEDCLNSKKFIAKLTSNNWEQWVIIENPKQAKLFGLVSKRCMEPRFPKNTVFIVDSNLEPEDGDLVIVHYPDTREATLRELSIDGPDRLLLSINPNRPQEVLTPKIKLLGVVIQSRFSYNHS
jgi:transcriptional regulator with XRE-family HTH domain